MRAPDFQGGRGRAWHNTQKTKPDHEACIGAVLLNVPGAHPLWSWWCVSMVHLRALPGVPPATIHYPAAEYEFMIFSVDPERCPSPEPDQGQYPHLEPFDVVYQFHGVSDDQAKRIFELAVQSCVDGRMSPDSDYRSAWKRTIDATVEHFITGHGLN